MPIMAGWDNVNRTRLLAIFRRAIALLCGFVESGHADAMSATLYLIAWVGTLLDQLGGVRLAGGVAGMAIILFLALEFRRQRPMLQGVLAVLLAGGLIAVLNSADPWAVWFAAWRRGAAYAAFFFALGALRFAAQHSAIILRCGQHLLSQPVRRRYLALTAGGHLFSIILSYGAIDLLGAMLRRSSAKARGRMMLAAYRGFGTMNCWSPLNIMTAVVSAAVPSADLRPLLPAGFGVAMLMLAAGWWLDGRTPTAAETPAPSSDNWAIHLAVIALVVLVSVLAGLIGVRFGVGLSTGITAAVPMVALVWVLVQLRRRRAVVGLFGRRLKHFYRALPGFRGEAGVLAAGGFLGVALGAALPAGGLAPWLQVLPPLAVPLLVPVVLLATSLLGLNPIAIVAVIGAAVPDPRALGVAPAVLAFACMLGWGVGVGMTPMSASAIATARWSDSDPWTVTVRWNAGFTALALAIALVAIGLAHGMLSP